MLPEQTPAEPSSPVSPTIATPDAPAPFSDLANRRVLVVEDEGVTQMQLRKILTRNGLIVAGSAENGPEGVRQTLELRPDLVLMDISMPGEYDGLEAARRILKEYAVCLVILTAFTEYAEQAAQVGASGYLIKPVSSALLLPQLQDALRRFHSQQAEG